jgi:uncharacterized protein YbjT (DUF2867 family)
MSGPHPDLPTLAVTGSTGAVGGEVARTLAGRGVPLRLLVRSPSRAPSLEGVAVVGCTYAEPGEALEGVRVLFMVSASESVDRLAEHRSFVEAAARAGVEHVVYTSFLNASPEATFTLARDHHATELMIREAGLGFTFLRDSLYLDFLASLVGDDGVVRGPAGSGALAGVARHDVAASAVAVLHDPAAHAGATDDLTGREALTFAEVAGVLARHLGREVRFHDETVEEAYASRRRYGAPDWQLDAWVTTYTAIAAGELATVSGDVERLTGRPPLTLDELLTRRA